MVELANTVAAQRVLEVGCGLAEIISRVNAVDKIGVDVSVSAIKAARFLHPNIKFFVGSQSEFQTTCLNLSAPIDLAIMVNWPHELPFKSISQMAETMRQTCSVRYLIIDTIEDHMDGYPYHHKTDDLRTLGKIVKTVVGADKARLLFLIELD